MTWARTATDPNEWIRYELRMSLEERNLIKAAAALSNMPDAEWIRTRLRSITRNELKAATAKLKTTATT